MSTRNLNEIQLTTMTTIYTVSQKTPMGVGARAMTK